MSGVAPWGAELIRSVAIRLAGGDILKVATAGKPDCYRKV